MGSAIGMDKLRTKRLALAWRGDRGLRGAARRADFEPALERLKACRDREARHPGLERRHDQGRARPRICPPPTRSPCSSRRWCCGKRGSRDLSTTVACCRSAPCPRSASRRPGPSYDLRGEYFRDDTRYFCPSGLSHSAEEHLPISRARRLRGRRASGWGRVDFMMDARQALLLEITPFSGHDRSQPGAWRRRAIDVDFDRTRVARARDQFHRGPPQVRSERYSNMLGRPKNRRKPSEHRRTA